MKNKRALSLAHLLLAITISLSGQSIERSVIAAGGDWVTGPGIQLSWTIGQPGLTETFSSPSVVLMQGFQQADVTTEIVHPVSLPFDVILYPNPSSGLLNFSLVSDHDGKVYFSLYDITGKLVVQQGPFETAGGRWQHQQHTHDIAPGIYHCRIVLSGSNGLTRHLNVKATIL